MRTFLKSSIFFLFTAFSSIATETIGIINDTFFTCPDTIVTFRLLIPHNDSYMAIIDGSDVIANKSVSIVPFFTKSWIHDDIKQESKVRIDATVLCGTRKLENSLMLELPVAYQFLREIEEKSGELSLETQVTVYKMKEFKRADDSIYKLLLNALYHLEMKEVRFPATDVTQCTKEWVITSQWQRKTRHSRRHYSAVDVYHITSKVPVTSSLTLTSPIPSEEISRVFTKKELRFKSFEAETPECGNNGGNLPAGSVVI
jgi:hypothetical protein